MTTPAVPFWQPIPIASLLPLVLARSPTDTEKALQDVGVFLIVLHMARQYGESAVPGCDGLAKMVGGKRDRALKVRKEALGFLRSFLASTEQRRKPAAATPIQRRDAATDRQLAEARQRMERAEEFARQADSARQFAERQAESARQEAEGAHRRAVESEQRARVAEAALKRAEGRLQKITQELEAARRLSDASPTSDRRPSDASPTPDRRPSDAESTRNRRDPDAQTPTSADSSVPSVDVESTSIRRGSDGGSTSLRSGVDGTERATRPPGSTKTKTLTPTFTGGGGAHAEAQAGELHHLPPPEGSEEIPSGRLPPEHIEAIWDLASRRVRGVPPDPQPGRPDCDGLSPDQRAAIDISERFGNLPDVRLVAAAEWYLRDWLRKPERTRWPRDYPTLHTWARGVSNSLAHVAPPPDPGADDDGDTYGQPDITDAAPPHPDWVREGLKVANHPSRDHRRRPAAEVLLWLQEHDPDTHRAVLSLTKSCPEAEPPRKVASR